MPTHPAATNSTRPPRRWRPAKMNEHRHAQQPRSLFRAGFPNANLTVDFTHDAPDERQAWRGAWLELKPDDPAARCGASLNPNQH